MINCKIINNYKGITMLALTITVIVLLIISGVSIVSGTKIINKVKAENIVTNMISMKAKTKICIEEVNSKTWNLNEEKKKARLVSEPYYFKVISNDEDIIDKVSADIKNNGCICYEITKETLNYMNLNGIYGYDKIGKEQQIHYVAVVNNLDLTKIEIVYTKGVNYSGNTYYTLSDLQANL